MDLRRISSAIIGIPLVLVVLIFGNNYVVDIAFSIIAMIGLYEYFKAVSKKSKPIFWVGYLAALGIAFIHIIPSDYLGLVGLLAIPTILLILFLHIIITEMKINFRDIVYTLFGICYVAILVTFLALIRGMENGKILIWYAIIAAWATDIFAYFIGKNFGRHKFSKISPKKSIEGCIGGTIGAIIVAIIYTLCINNFAQMDYSYVAIMAITLILSIIGQIGDFAASSIKRYVDIKDYSELIPGHGGMLDRIDSLLFIAPFAYAMFMFL